MRLVLIAALLMPVSAQAEISFANKKVAERDLPAQVVISKWKGRKCEYCDLWIDVERPKLRAAGVDVVIDESLPLSEPAPRITVCWPNGSCYTRSRYMTYLEMVTSQNAATPVSGVPGRIAAAVEPEVIPAPLPDPEPAKVVLEAAPPKKYLPPPEPAVKPLEGPGYRPTDRSSDLLARVARLETKMSSIERRVTDVEEQLLAIVSYKMSDGKVYNSEVVIDYVEGYGEFEVPVGGRVVAIDGVPINRTQSTVNGFPVWSSGSYSTWVSRPVAVGQSGMTSVRVQSCANGNCGF